MGNKSKGSKNGKAKIIATNKAINSAVAKNNGNVKKAVATVVNSLEDLATIVVDPPAVPAMPKSILPSVPVITPPVPQEIVITAPKFVRAAPTTVKDKKVFGVTLHTYTTLEGNKYTKILTKIDGKWLTVLAYNPTTVLEPFVEVSFTLGKFNKKNKELYTAENIVVENDCSASKEILDSLFDKNAYIETEMSKIYIDDFVIATIENTMVGNTVKEKAKNLLNHLGIKYIVGELKMGEVVVVKK